MKTKHDKRAVKWLARNSKAKIVDWTRRLVRELDAANPERAEKLMRLMQELARGCDRLDRKWAAIVKD